MKKPNDHIFQIIHAMSPAEKRYFRLHFASGANQLTDLFDAVNRMKGYDEETLKGKVPKTVAKNIKVYKIQLQDLLLKSLTSYHSKRSVLSRVRTWLEEADILAEKQLFDQALDRLGKAKAICLHYEEFTYLLEISAREFYLKHVSNDRIGISKHPYFEEVEEFIRKISTGLNYHRISSEWIEYLMQAYHRPPGEAEQRKALDIIEQEESGCRNDLSFRAQLSRNTLLMSVFKLVNNVQKEGETRQANVRLFQAFPQFQETMPFQYIAVLRNLMNYSLEHRNFDTAQDCIETGLALIRKNPAFASQAVYFHYAVLEMNFECRQWDHILNAWEQPVMQNLKKQGIAGERIAMLCYIYLAVCNQILNKSAKVQFYLRKARECREEVRSYFAELLTLLDLINHWEAGDDFLVAKQMKTIKRKTGEGTQPESPLFQDFLQLFACKKQEDRPPIAARILSGMPKWEGSALGFMVKKNGLQHWLQAVAAGRSFSQEMQSLPQ